MNDQAAIIIAASARAMIRAMGMHALNMQRAALGESMGYREEAFLSVIDEECIGHNAVKTAMNGGA